MQKWKFWSAVPTRKSAGLLATVLALASVVGCSSPVEKYDGPQAAAGQYALDHATSDFEREVLGDLMVTREEYVEAIDRYVKCISDNGSSVTPVDQRGLFVFKISGDVPKYDSIAGDCGKERFCKSQIIITGWLPTRKIWTKQRSRLIALIATVVRRIRFRRQFQAVHGTNKPRLPVADRDRSEGF